MKTLQDLLLERVVGSDQRAAHAVIDVRGGNVRLLLGAVGDLGRIILSVEDNEVKILHPSQVEEGKTDEEGEDGEAGERRPVDTEAGEFVDDNDPLKPGENPIDAVARIEAEGLDARQPEAVSTTTPLAAADLGAGDGSEMSGNSEIKNSQSGTSDDSDAGDKDDAGGAHDESGRGSGFEPVKVELVDPDAQTKEQLLALAKDEGVDVTNAKTKADIANAINSKRGTAAS